MRVVMVTSWYPTVAMPVGGIFVRREAELIATEHDVDVIHLVHAAALSPEDALIDEQGPVRVVRLPLPAPSPRGLLTAWPHLAPRLQGADVLHTQAFSTLLAFAGRRVPTPWVHSEHWSGIADPAGLPPRGRAVVALTGRLLGRPDVVTTVSDYLGDRVRRYRRGPIAVVPSVVDPAATVAPPRDPAEIRLVAVGRLLPGKDPFLALDTLRELHRRGVGASLTWVGEGPLGESLTAAAEPADRFVMPGPTDAVGVSAALDAADIFLLPTRGETLCLSALEAITHGRPVVIGARGGQREYIVPENGRLVEQRTASAYADAVLDVWAHRDQLSPSDVAGSLGDRFTTRRVLDGYNAAYEAARAAHD